MKYAVIFLLSFTSIFAVHVLSKLFASDEVKIERLIKRMETGFNDGSVRRTIYPIDEHWTHHDSRVDRGLLEDGLRARFFTERNPSTRDLLIKVKVPPETVSIKVAKAAATVRCEARFHRMLADQWKLAWHIQISATLKETEEGWRIIGSSHKDLEGNRF